MQPAFRIVATFLLALTVAAFAAAGPAHANPRYAAYVMDANTGQVLFSRYANDQRFPASLTKMMTAYMIFDAMESGRIGRNSAIPISARAAAEPPTKIGLRAGSSITVNDAILALVTRSANDISTAVAEHLGGSEAGFARQMTAKARELGMNSTTFQNAHGLPNAGQVTSARDMAILGLALREHFPQHYHYFSARSAVINGTRFNSHNRVIGRVTGADGIKTGFIRASGFNLVSSVQADGRSIVAVVMGGRTAASRDDHMVALIREHLPRASRASNGPLLARRGGGTAVAAAQRLPTTQIPTPQFRPETAQVAAVAAAPQVQPSAYAAPETPVAIAAMMPSNPVPKIAVGDAAEPAAVAVDTMTTAALPAQGSATSAATGWAVQVAAAPSANEARAILDRIAAQASDLVGRAEPFTAEFTSNGTVYHRARFGGFASSTEAWNACNALKRRNIDCYAAEL